MKKVLIVFALMSALQFNTVNAQKNFTVNGVNIPRTIEFKGVNLTLNGVGQRSKFFTDLYIQALYLTKFNQDAKQILESGNEMAVALHITSGLITSKKLSKALAKGMEKSVGESGVLKFAKELQELEDLLSTEETKSGDVFELTFNPQDESLWITKNKIYRGKIKGLEFKKAFYGIWLSENPVDKTLKEDLLGKE
ncbi:chalcone isomerase family protein [Flavobacterium sp. CHNK8]|uniref:chalcone isomerase family protein n=1 Tax=Flavobacterium sp. CHNK8 TaxID=2871165 RepID=UPI001C8DAA90|nr:chalcone isomerase family protein [Flavobacterium sp. CHNK8]QZK89482.1 chalcone isomerase family protein [Flavobacterium sp. CHNK8]